MPPSPTTARLEEAMVGADIFLGLSKKGAVSPAMVASMAKNPIIFAMANPDPEITPEEVAKVRSDAIVATGRSDYPNQVNNVLCFPYLFRGALDVRATAINEEMKLAAANAIAALARMQVPDEVAAAYGGKTRNFGPEYIIPAPFDPRLIEEIPTAVAKAAMASGVAKKPFFDEAAYRHELRSRLNPTTSILAGAVEAAHAAPAPLRLCRSRTGSRAARRRQLPQFGLWRAGARRPRSAGPRSARPYRCARCRRL